jgi:Uma2 family endonuclease
MTVLAEPLPIASGQSLPITPEQMLEIDEGPLHELVDGQLVEKSMSDYAQLVSNLLSNEINFWARSTGAGLALVEATYRCFPHDPNMVRRPDVSFISATRLADYSWTHGHLTLAPDLAAEIVSPRDEVYELDRKIDDYFQAGVRRIWVLNPERRIVRIHRAPGDLDELVGDAELTDDQVLPGFRCPLPTLFTALIPAK